MIPEPVHFFAVPWFLEYVLICMLNTPAGHAWHSVPETLREPGFSSTISKSSFFPFNSNINPQSIPFPPSTLVVPGSSTSQNDSLGKDFSINCLQVCSIDSKTEDQGRSKEFMV